MKILVTGAAGFIGSNICEYFQNLGATVIGVDSLINGTLQNVVIPERQFYQLDLSRRLQLGLLNGVDYVFHNAALGSVPRSFMFPNIVMENNFNATSNILHAAKTANVKKVICASSSSVLGMKSPYAYSKNIDESLVRMHRELLNQNVVSVRYFNVYGPRQKLDHEFGAVIPRWIDKIKNREPVIINGMGAQTRSFTYVGDVCEAMTKIIEDNRQAVFSVGNPNSVNLLEVFWELKRQMLAGEKVHVPMREGDILDSKCEPTVDVEWTRLAVGLKRTLQSWK